MPSHWETLQQREMFAGAAIPTPSQIGAMWFDTTTSEWKYATSISPVVFVVFTSPAGPAPATASYVVMGLDGVLVNERVLTAGGGISLADSGPGGTVTVNLGSHDHTSAANDGGVLTNDEHDGYSQYSEIAVPGTSPANTARLFTRDKNGHTVFEIIESAGTEYRVCRDNFIIAKINEAGGVVIGEAVYISGAVGANEEIKKAKSDSDTTMPCFGIALGSGALNDFIKVIFAGKVTGFDTSAFTEGDTVYVSATVAGALTNVVPASPNIRQRAGIITRSHAINGEILVTPLVSLAYGPALGLANANADGTLISFARSDHQHKRDVRVANAGVDVGTRNRLNFITGNNISYTIADDAGADEIDITINAAATVRKNSGADVGTRRRLNFIEGANITFTITDDPGSDEIDITAAAAGGGGSADIKAATITAPYNSYDYSEIVVDATIPVGALIMLGWGATTDDDENTPDMEDINFQAVADPAGGQFTALISASSNNAFGGPFKLNYLVG